MKPRKCLLARSLQAGRAKNRPGGCGLNVKCSPILPAPCIFSLGLFKRHDCYDR